MSTLKHTFVLAMMRSSIKSLLPIYEQKEQLLEHLIKIWERFPHKIDETIFKKVDLLFVLTSDEFKEQRSQKHLLKILFFLFFVQKSLRRSVTFFGEKRHLQFRLMPTTLKFPFGSKSALGLLVGICLFDKQEIFEEKHLLLAVQKFLPHVQIIKGSLFLHHDAEDSIRLIYVEFEKKGGGSFSVEEISLLKRELSEELQSRVEKNTPSLFMVRNEEEVMKNILLLGRELDQAPDIPEMIINFEKQLPEALSFTVILVRAVKEGCQPLEEIFHKFTANALFYLERSQIIGYLEGKYPKEATVFRLEIPLEESFFRADFSINFFLARQRVKSIIAQAIGPIRDFNGGMMLKQGELLSRLKEEFKHIDEKNPLLIENFFYALSPIEKQATLPFNILCYFFEMFLEAAHGKPLNEELPFEWKVSDEEKNLFVVIRSDNFNLFKKLENEIGFLNVKQNLVFFKINLKNFSVIGFIHKKKSSEISYDFLQKIKKGIDSWKEEYQNRQIARLAIRYIPTSFDPRVGGDENSRLLLKMLFEGLMRIGKNGKPELALAESVTISSDKKTYLFHLRPSVWSDGCPLVAYDFEYAWKRILSPQFQTQFVMIFYLIKNARFVKEGKLSIDEVGIKALNDHLLQVDLEYPAPYFLELIALPLFSPISHKKDKIHPNWAFQDGDAYICNGPFCLKKKNISYGYEFVKNPHYWDAEAVSLDQIQIRKIKDSSAYEMFGKGSIDWIGRLFPYWDPTCAKQYHNKMKSYPSPKLSWCVFNTHQFPFNNPKIRKALSFAIDKNKLISYLDYEDAIPASSPLPQSHILSEKQTPQFNLEHAIRLFQEGLEETGLKKENFPAITLLFPSFVLHEKTAQFIRQQWMEYFNITCEIAFYEWPELFPKICQGDYQISLMTWTSWINDPIYTLNYFKYANEGINFSKWENPRFKQLLDLSDQTIDEIERLKLLKEAEKILIDELPVSALFFERSQCLSQDHFQVFCDPIYGYPDFKWAYIDRSIKKTETKTNFLTLTHRKI